MARIIRLAGAAGGAVLAVLLSLPGGGTAPAGLTVPLGTSTCTDGWPMFQHDTGRTGGSSCTSINRLNVATLHPGWFFQTSQPVTASPVVSDGQVYVGDGGGTFYDIVAATGKAKWTFAVVQSSYRCASGTVPGDVHAISYGEITSSAAVADVAGVGTTVFVGGGGTLFALDAATGACRWAVNLDPSNPKSAMEVESSPLVTTGGRPAVIVGSDGNESPDGSAPPGLQAFDAATGTLLWKFEPENNQTVTTLADPHADTNGCGDVWSSPSYDQNGAGGDGLVVLTTGNCPEGSENPGQAVGAEDCGTAPAPPDVEGIAALDAATGCLQWRWSEPDNQYTNPALADGGDTDFGASPILATVAGTKMVLDGSKSGYAYGLAEADGHQVWANQLAEPGQTGAALAGAIGGFIGSMAFGSSDGRPALFGSTAIPAVFSGAGVQSSGVTPDTSLICITITRSTPSLDLKHCDPLRLAALHAADAATGTVRWQALTALPSYAAVTYDDGLVFAPSTTGFQIDAYDATTGVPLWVMPTLGAMSSAAAVVGNNVFVGAGTSLAGGSPSLPPQENGVWDFTTGLPGGL